LINLTYVKRIKYIFKYELIKILKLKNLKKVKVSKQTNMSTPTNQYNCRDPELIEYQRYFNEKTT